MLLTEQMQARVGGLSKLTTEPLPSDDPTQRQPEFSSAKELLGWEPTIQLDQGLDATIEYFRRTMLAGA